MSIEFTQFAQHLSRLAVAVDAADWQTPLRGPVRDEVLQGVRDNFTSSASPDNVSWPARKNPGDGHPLLIDTGKLMQAAVGNGSGKITRATSNELVLGVDTSIKYAAVHNYGGIKKPIPKREYMGNRPERIDSIAEVVADAGLEIIARVPDA